MKITIASAVMLAFFSLAAAGHAELQKVIKDPAEYNAYTAALNTADAAQKAAAMEKFILTYPNSIVREDALEQAMAAYQLANNQAGVEKSATRLLKLDKSNVRALAILTFLDRAKATQGDKAALAAMKSHAQRGAAALASWNKPDGMSDADFAKLRGQMTTIFEGALGFAAIEAKDYAAARKAYLRAVKIDANDIQTVYQLGIAELEMSPVDASGFWHIARAIALAKAQKQDAAVSKIDAYGRAKYKRYHGNESGWDAIVARAAGAADEPRDFAKSIKAAPTPAELAVNAVHDNDPSTLSFGDYEFVLGFRDASPANKDAAAKVWQAIQAVQKNGTVKVKLAVKIISASATSLDVAITDDNQQANIADMRVALAKPLAQIPAPGAMMSVVGLITDYTPKPFLFAMKDGEVAAVK